MLGKGTHVCSWARRFNFFSVKRSQGLPAGTRPSLLGMHVSKQPPAACSGAQC